MDLDLIDLEILEAAYYDEPWHILCEMVTEYFDDIKNLIPRVMRLQKEGLLEIIRDPGTNIDPTQEDLERIAIKHDVFGTTNWPEGPTWSIKTTEEGFKFIKDRFK